MRGVTRMRGVTYQKHSDLVEEAKHVHMWKVDCEGETLGGDCGSCCLRVAAFLSLQPRSRGACC